MERDLEERMRSRTVAACVDVLSKAGIGAHRVVPSLVELMTDPLVQSRGLAITRTPSKAECAETLRRLTAGATNVTSEGDYSRRNHHRRPVSPALQRSRLL